MTSPKTTFVYVDSFNMYYGVLKKVRNSKWLNVQSWIEKILPVTHYRIEKIKYFTANVSAPTHDLQRPVRQDIYFRTLKTLPAIEIIKGRFKPKTVNIQVTKDIKIMATVPEEKGTDVNLSVHLVNDAHNNLFDTAVVISNDSDLAEAVHIVAQDMGKEVWVINPCLGTAPSRELNQYASQTRSVREHAIKSSQFNPTLSDTKGSFSKPPSW